MRSEKGLPRNHRGKKQKEIAEKIKALDAELMSFYDFCEKMGFSAHEMDHICSPLNEVITRSGLTRIAKGILIVVVIFGLVYGASHIAPIATHSNAVGRIALLKTCEALDSINVISRTSYKVLSDNYFNRDAPVIISDAMDTWDVMNSPLQFENFTELFIEDPKLTDTVPCILTTNLRQGGPDLHSFLRLINNASIKKWFVHW